MPTYAAVIGHQPKVSIAELAAAFPGFTLLEQTAKIVIRFRTDHEITADDGNRLGGTVLIAREIAMQKTSDFGDLPALLVKELQNVRGKATFSLRAFGLPRPDIHKLYRDCKAHLKKIGRPSRYIGSEREPAAPVLLHDAGVADGKRGCELFLLAQAPRYAGKKEKGALPLWIGRTIFVQDIASYAARDMGKPARDTSAGLLPPKLAQVLLTFGRWLASQDKGQRTKDIGQQKIPKRASVPKSEVRSPKSVTIFDPFCGMGVIPMEALLQGMNVLAADVSQKAVNATERNIEWLRKERNIGKRDFPSVVWKQDALKPFALKESPDVLVTETTLGPSLTLHATVKEALKLKTQSDALEVEFLRNVAASLPGVPIVMMWPIWFTSKGAILLERAWDALHACGYRATLPPGMESDVPGRLSLLYRRPDQFVGREILMLQPTKRTS